MIQGTEFHIYMIEEGADRAQVEELSQLCRAHHSQLHPLEVPDGLFTDAPGGAVLLPGHVLPPSGGRAAAPGTGQGALSGPGYPGDPAGAAPV